MIIDDTMAIAKDFNVFTSEGKPVGKIKSLNTLTGEGVQYATRPLIKALPLQNVSLNGCILKQHKLNSESRKMEWVSVCQIPGEPTPPEPLSEQDALRLLRTANKDGLTPAGEDIVSFFGHPLQMIVDSSLKQEVKADFWLSVLCTSIEWVTTKLTK